MILCYDTLRCCHFYTTLVTAIDFRRCRRLRRCRLRLIIATLLSCCFATTLACYALFHACSAPPAAVYAVVAIFKMFVTVSLRHVAQKLRHTPLCCCLRCQRRLPPYHATHADATCLSHFFFLHYVTLRYYRRLRLPLSCLRRLLLRQALFDATLMLFTMFAFRLDADFAADIPAAMPPRRVITPADAALMPMPLR